MISDRLEPESLGVIKMRAVLPDGEMSTKSCIAPNTHQFFSRRDTCSFEKSALSKTETSHENKVFSITLCMNCKISICKPLFPLKLAQFCWFGAGSFMTAFLTVFLKQRGVSLKQLSWMNVIAPVIQLTGSTLSGVMADKIGRAKPVLVANILLVTSALFGIIILPSMSKETERLTISCSSVKFDRRDAPQNCSIRLDDCFVQCAKANHQLCSRFDSTCSRESLIRNNFSQFNSMSTKDERSCYLDIVSNKSAAVVGEWCSQPENKTCQLSCELLTGEDSQSNLLIGYIILYVLYVTVYSNVYRCFDVTSMTLTKEHGGDFGFERFFAMLGNLIISPIAGFIVDATTVDGGARNYVAGFYLFFAMVGVVLIILYKLPVTVNPPSEKMGRKSWLLLKNADTLSLIVVVLTLGTAWNFTKIYVFWYLADMNATSVLMGLIPSLSALYGLPFLLTSKWWVRKIGSTQLIVVAFFGYVAMCSGYSLLTNPWYSLALESFGGISYYLLWVAVVVHCHQLAPEGMKNTVVAVAGAIHFSVGKASGGLVGGLVMANFGGRVAFRFIAALCCVVGILYVLFLRTRHLHSRTQQKLTLADSMSPSEKQTSCIFVVQNNSHSP